MYLALLSIASLFQAPGWTTQSSGTAADLRGLSAVSAKVVWASGTKGTVLHTTDGGATWRADTVPGASALDFRDVKAFDERTAYVLSAAPGAQSRIYKTTDGGAHWALQFTNADSAGFFDAMAFWDRTHGIAMSDPVGGRFLIVATNDGGRTWTRADPAAMPPALQSEGAFAASGTCLVALGANHAWLASGGAKVSRVYHTSDRGKHWSVVETPVAAGSAPRGIFSLAFADAQHGIAIGGDYQHPTIDSATVALTQDGGRTWRLATGRAHGYRSGSAIVPGTKGRRVFAVGTGGTDVSSDGGDTWAHVDDTEYNSVAFVSDASGWAVGPKGRIARWGTGGTK
jgi:photosystem II stability/assembly factor-like uncharacterized protein